MLTDANEGHFALKEYFILSAGAAIVLAISFHLIMFVRLGRREDFGALWERDLFSQGRKDGHDRVLLKIRIYGAEAKQYFSTVPGLAHLILFSSAAVAALAFGIGWRFFYREPV